jgi:hypothetical protein
MVKVPDPTSFLICAFWPPQKVKMKEISSVLRQLPEGTHITSNYLQSNTSKEAGNLVFRVGISVFKEREKLLKYN